MKEWNYLCIAPYYYGWGMTKNEALSNCKKQGRYIRKTQCIIIDVRNTERFEIDGMGGLYWNGSPKVAYKGSTCKLYKNLKQGDML